MLVLAAVAVAQSPLMVSVAPIEIPNAGLLVDAAPADGVPDGWVQAVEKGGLEFAAERDKDGLSHTRLSWEAGTKASICSSAVPVSAGTTLRLSGRVRGEAGLGDVTALHLHITGATGELHVARRRFDTGAFPWEDVEILSTVPPGGYGAFACWEVQMVKDAGGALQFDPLRLEALTAESRAMRMPLRRIVLVSIETFRRDHVHAYGYPRLTTPNLDALIAEGASLDRHYTQAPYTHPSLAALLTGQLPTTLGFVDNIPTLGTAVPTLAELMAQAGYVTAAFNVQYVLSNRYGLNRGFHYYRNHPNDTPANALNDELLPFLAEHAEDNLFTWVHYFDPHGPYRPPLRFRDFFAGDPLWAADTRKLERGEQAEGQPLIPKYVFDGGKFERRHYVGAYDADLAWTDSELGRLVDWLKATSANDTLIVVTADHGESMTDHDRYFCHGSLYEHDIHVPMVVWGPGVVAGPRDVRTAHVDILPTLLDYAGVGALPGFAGSSLRPLLAGGAWTPPPFTLSVVGRAENLRYAVVGDSGQKAIVDRGGGVLSAYDLLVDPQETASARGAAKKGVVAMARDFRKWLKGVTVKESKAQSADTEDQERLRALGYIE